MKEAELLATGLGLFAFILKERRTSMRRHLLVFLASLIPVVSHGGWFTRDEQPNTAEQLIRKEERLTAAEQQIQAQQQTITHLNGTITVVSTGAVILLIVGVVLGSRARSHGNPS